MLANPSVQKLSNLDDFNDFEEIVEGVLETVEAGFNLFKDGKFDFTRLGALLGLYSILKLAVEDSKDMFRELAIISDVEFDASFAKASNGFDLENNMLEHDIKGLAKGVCHVIRMASRSKLNAEVTSA